MNYPIIKNKQGQQLAILNNIANPLIREQINGEYTFTFTAIMNELKSEYVHYNNIIEANNNLFNIVQYKKIHGENKKVITEVYCEQVSYDLLDQTFDSFEMKAATPYKMLDNILQGTKFTLDKVEIGGAKSIKIENATNARAIMNLIINEFGGEYQFDKYKISLVEARGTNRGVQFRIGKNIKGISKDVDAREKDEKGNPKTTYEIVILELNELKKYKGLEGFQIGDTVRIIDEDLGINLEARIFELEYNPLQRINTKVVLGNIIDIGTNQIVKMRQTANLISSKAEVWERAKAINPDGTIYTDVLEGQINALRNVVNAGGGTVLVTDEGILIRDGKTHETSRKAMLLANGTLALSNKKDVNNNWIWRSFGNGDGFTADEIVSGKILSRLIDAGTITFGMLERTAQDKVNTAKSTADSAKSTAVTAKSKANSAESKADSAKNTADAALNKAKNSIQKGVKYDKSVMLGDGRGLVILDDKNKVRGHFGQYEPGEYGVKIIGGKIFGTEIRSGPEGAKSYVNISAGFEPFRIVDEGKTTLTIWSHNGEGYIQSYKDGKIVGQMLPYDDAQGKGFRVQARGDSIGYETLNLDGKSIVISAHYGGGGVRIYPEGEEFFVDGDTFIHGDYRATGTKNAIVETEHYGKRLLNCIESTEIKFCDEGIAILKDGICRIDIDPIFLETIEKNSDCPYIVHLTPYDWLNLRVKEIGDSYFIVEEKEKLDGKFVWRLSATRKGYKDQRLEQAQQRGDKLCMKN